MATCNCFKVATSCVLIANRFIIYFSKIFEPLRFHRVNWRSHRSEWLIPAYFFCLARGWNILPSFKLRHISHFALCSPLLPFYPVRLQHLKFIVLSHYVYNLFFISRYTSCYMVAQLFLYGIATLEPCLAFLYLWS